MNVRLEVNRKSLVIEVKPDERLIDSLREKLGLCGTKEGCGIGECGACSVLVDHKLISACLVLTWQVHRCAITTIEGLQEQGQLNDLQQAFVREGAVQCGFCTPGMIMAGQAILQRYQRPTTQQIRAGIAGNLCRCTGYAKIIAAIRKTAQKRARQKIR